MTILISLHRLLERLAKAPSTQHSACPGPIPGRHTSTALWLCGRAGLHPRLGGKGALRFRAGQREAAVYPGVPGCQGPRQCHSADGSAVQQGQAAPEDRHQRRRASSTSERSHMSQGLFRCPKPPTCLFLMYSDRAPKIHTLLRIDPPALLHNPRRALVSCPLHTVGASSVVTERLGSPCSVFPLVSCGHRQLLLEALPRPMRLTDAVVP